jgi:hypothetical protein
VSRINVRVSNQLWRPGVPAGGTTGQYIRKASSTDYNTEWTNNILVLGILTVPTSTPTSASATGTTGTVTWDSNYIYICVATNTWKRVAISTW